MSLNQLYLSHAAKEETVNDILDSMTEKQRTAFYLILNHIISNSDNDEVSHSDDYLEHYGIIGMKWGVRRYQNEDGSYTAEGLERYRAAKGAYKQAKKEYKEAKASGDLKKTSNAQAKVEKAKGDVKKARKRLDDDIHADRGRSLYRKGKTVSQNEANSATSKTLRAMGTTAIAGAGIFALTSGLDKSVRTKYGDVPIAALLTASGGVALGVSSTMNALRRARTKNENRDMRTYWNRRHRNG